MPWANRRSMCCLASDIRHPTYSINRRSFCVLLLRQIRDTAFRNSLFILYSGLCFKRSCLLLAFSALLSRSLIMFSEYLCALRQDRTWPHLDQQASLPALAHALCSRTKASCCALLVRSSSDSHRGDGARPVLSPCFFLHWLTEPPVLPDNLADAMTPTPIDAWHSMH